MKRAETKKASWSAVNMPLKSIKTAKKRHSNGNRNRKEATVNAQNRNSFRYTRSPQTGGDPGTSGLRTIAPVYVVRGNNDKDWAEHIPMFLDFQLYGCHIYMTHKKKDLPQDLSDYDLVVYGHSHRYEQKSSGKTLLLNPGSCGPRRFHQDITMAIAEVDNYINVGIDSCTDISSEAKTPNTTIHGPDTASDAQTLKITIHRIDIPHEQMGMEEDFAEQICRLYLTHPGVTAEGIMTKMGL